MKKLNKLKKLMILALSIILLVFACKNEDPLDLSLKIKTSNIKGTSAKISWELFSQQVLSHDITVSEVESGNVIFEGSTAINFDTEEVILEIEVTGLSPETDYDVTVAANTFGETLNKVVVKKDNSEFKTIELQEDEMEAEVTGEEFTDEDIAGKWLTNNTYYVFNVDKSGETGSHSEIAGFEDEKEDNITWERMTITISDMDMTTGELVETEVNGIKAIDSEGSYIELQFSTVDGEKVLIDNDNNQTYKKGDAAGGEEEEASYTKEQFDDTKWTGEQMVLDLNIDNTAKLILNGMEYSDASWVLEGTTINVQPAGMGPEAFEILSVDSLQYGDVILTKSEGTPGEVDSNEDVKFDEYINIIGNKIEAENFIRGGEGIGYHEIDDNNQGGLEYRTGGVDIEGVIDGNKNIGYTAEGEWLKYNINVPSTGAYHLLINTASAATEASQIIIKIDDEVLIENMQLLVTGDWTAYQDVSSTTMNLTEGDHTLTIEIASEGSNFDYFQFVEGESTVTDDSGASNSTYKYSDFVGEWAGGIYTLKLYDNNTGVLIDKDNNNYEMALDNIVIEEYINSAGDSYGKCIVGEWVGLKIVFKIENVEKLIHKGGLRDTEMIKDGEDGIVDGDSTDGGDGGGDNNSSYSIDDFKGSTFEGSSVTVIFSEDGSYSYLIGSIDMSTGANEWRFEDNMLISSKDGVDIYGQKWIIDDIDTIHLNYSEVSLKRQQ